MPSSAHASSVVSHRPRHKRTPRAATGQRFPGLARPTLGNTAALTSWFLHERAKFTNCVTETHVVDHAARPWPRIDGDAVHAWAARMRTGQRIAQADLYFALDLLAAYRTLALADGQLRPELARTIIGAEMFTDGPGQDAWVYRVAYVLADEDYALSSSNVRSAARWANSLFENLGLTPARPRLITK